MVFLYSLRLTVRSKGHDNLDTTQKVLPVECGRIIMKGKYTIWNLDCLHIPFASTTVRCAQRTSKTHSKS